MAKTQVHRDMGGVSASHTLSEHASKEIVAAYGVILPKERLCGDASAAAAAGSAAAGAGTSRTDGRKSSTSSVPVARATRWRIERSTPS